MTIQHETESAILKWNEFVSVGAQTNFSDAADAMRLQDALTELRNQLNSLNAAIEEKIKETTARKLKA
jgi:hypothetical protein